MSKDVDFWNGLAERYAAMPVKNPDAFDRKTEQTLALMAPDHVVLDIGCGTGSLALRLAPAAKQVHGLDVSKEMVRIARQKAAAQSAENVTFHTGPFDSTFRVFEDGTLDGVCAYSILHLVDDHQEALNQVWRLLKPGGFFVSSTVCLKRGWVPYGVVLPVMRLVGKAPLVRVLHADDVERSMATVGFTGIRAPDVGANADIAFFVARKPN